MNDRIFEYLTLIVISLSVAWVISITLKKILTIFIFRYSKKLKTDPTNFIFIKNSIGFAMFILAAIFIFYKIPYLQSIGAALFAGVSILAVAIGFASQKAFSNIISGIFILIFKPFKISDTISFKDGQRGVVEEITLRHTIIVDYENKRIVIPNSIISEETIINSSIQDAKIRKHIEFSISYDTDINKAIRIIQQTSENHTLTIDNRTEGEKENRVPVVVVRVIALSDFSITLKAYVWAGWD